MHVLREKDFESRRKYENKEVVIKISGEKPNPCRAVKIQTTLTAELWPTTEKKNKINRKQDSINWFFIAMKEEAKKN